MSSRLINDKLLSLKNELMEIKIAPAVGGSIFSFKYNLEGNMVDIMRPTPEQALADQNNSDFGCYNLIPYSNRIENAVLKFAGEEYKLEKDSPEGTHAIHGEVCYHSCQVDYQEDNQLQLTFDSRDFPDISWPFPFSSQIEYCLQGNIFTLGIRIMNTGKEKMPVGMGIHPYFMRKLIEKDDQLLAQIPTIGVYPGEATIPEGHWVEVPDEIDFSRESEFGAQFLDKCFRVKNEAAYCKWSESQVKLTMTSDEIFRHMVIYRPQNQPQFFAIEPVTNCNNGFNMAAEGIDDTGTIILNPGEEAAGEINIEINRF